MSPANGGGFLSAPHYSVTKNPNFNSDINPFKNSIIFECVLTREPIFIKNFLNCPRTVNW